MSATFSHPFVDQRPTYLNRASALTYSLSPPGGHADDRTHGHGHHLHHHHHTATDSLAHSVPFILYPSGMDPAGLGLYEGSFRGHGPAGLLPYLSPFHHGRFGVYECPFEPAFIQKRNERERQRVKCVNQGYAKLRDHLPGGAGEKRLSKVETLRAAIRYIKYLQGLVEGKGGQQPESDHHRPDPGSYRLEDSGLSEEEESPNPHLDEDDDSSSSSSPGLDCGESEGSGC